MTVRRAGAALVVLTIGLALGGTGTAAADDDLPEVDRVLILSLPTLSWEDVRDADAPNLDALVADSAVGALSTRILEPSTTAGAGYSTISAGTRAEGVTDADGLGFDPDEEYGGEPASEVLARRTGAVSPTGPVALGQPMIQRHNDDLAFGAEVGALGDALRDGDVTTAVLGNGDHRNALDAWVYGREAVLALATSVGTVDGGSVGADLLVDEPDAASGVALDLDRVEDAFTEAFTDRSVVLVEASDLVRADTVDRDGPAAVADAIERTDELVGRLLAHVDPEHDAVLAIGPAGEGGSTHLTVATLRAPGVDTELLTSAVTRRAGFVTLADVAPTILDLVGVERPEDMEGRPFQVEEGSDADRVGFLVDADEGAEFRDDLVAAISAAVVVSQLLLWALLAWVRRGTSIKLQRMATAAAPVVLALLPVTYLAGLIPFHRLGVVPYLLFLVVGSLALGLGCRALFRRRPVDPLIAVLAVVVGLFVIDLLLGAPLQFNTVFGYTPTIAGRFAGLGNLAFAQFAAASLVLAALLAWRLAGPLGRRLAVGLLLLAVVLDGVPWWGSDVGGVLALVPATAVFVLLLWGRKVSLWSVLAAGAAAVACIVVAGIIDLNRPESDRTHLARLIERIHTEGFDALRTVIERKSEANLDVVSSSIWTILVPVGIAVLLLVLHRGQGWLATVRDELPTYGALIGAFSVLAVLGFTLNDSGIAVPAMMLSVINAALVHVYLGVGDG
jgi:hypothetical protein